VGRGAMRAMRVIRAEEQMKKILFVPFKTQQQEQKQDGLRNNGVL